MRLQLPLALRILSFTSKSNASSRIPRTCAHPPATAYCSQNIPHRSIRDAGVLLRQQKLPLIGGIDRDVANVVHARLDTQQIGARQAPERVNQLFEPLNPVDDPVIVLEHLITIHGILEVVGKCRPQVELVANDIGRKLHLIGVGAQQAIERETRSGSMPRRPWDSNCRSDR